MEDITFQTLIIDSRSRLSYSNGYIKIIKQEEDTEIEDEIYLDNISTILVNNLETTITVYLLNELKKRKINIIFGDEKKNPSLQLVSMYGSFESPSNLYEQLNWTQDYKNRVWYYLLKDKLTMEQKLLTYLSLEDNHIFDYYINRLYVPDETNIEGTLAKVYFRLLFGRTFNRRDNSRINAALNYGYMVLLSFINNIVVSYGYKTELGYNHHNKTNQFNLSCDYIEPFRSFIDKCVYYNQDKVLDQEYKLKLINVLYEKCIYNNKEMELRTALKIYIKEKLDSYRTNRIEESVIDFR